MDNGKFIHCRNCGAVHHVTVFDKAPNYFVVAGDTREAPADDWRVFMNRHAGHGLEALKALGVLYFPEGSAADPMAVGYLKVTNGHREYLLRRSRRSIGEPLRFECIEARFGEPMVALEIQEREIRKELKLRFCWDSGQALSDAQIDLFIALWRDAARQVDARAVTATEPSYVNHNISYAALEAPIKDCLLKQCAGHFNPGEVAALRRFVEAHSRGSDVMTLLLRRQVPIEERIRG
jgi:hypothetical protein